MEVFGYRAYVDEHVAQALRSAGSRALAAEIATTVVLGVHHEQQHQELILTDVKHLFAQNPLFPVYRERSTPPADGPEEHGWLETGEGLHEIGHNGGGFSYDNEGPRHRVFVQPFALGSRLITNTEFYEFMEDGGYDSPEHWLSLGWKAAAAEKWEAPLYWFRKDGAWHNFTLQGVRPVDPHEPVCHVSYYEADAFARWRGARLPTEEEWEITAAPLDAAAGNFVEEDNHHPVACAARGKDAPAQMFGDVWEWTGSSYRPYPGYQPVGGALGEYNGKFMSNQMVLRGGSCATSRSHIRATYRNFFPPDKRWQFSGIRLAKELS